MSGHPMRNARCPRWGRARRGHRCQHWQMITWTTSSNFSLYPADGLAVDGVKGVRGDVPPVQARGR
eukprot:2226314-Lingulodinium_polyedra.AAC.1